MRAHSGRVSISSCGSMPAVGVPVTLRMLSAPEPREHEAEILDALEHVRPRSSASISRICRLARVVTCE